jgi:hypothetical protein
MNASGGVDVQIRVFMTSALAGGEWSASLPGRLHPGQEPTVPIGAGLDDVEKRKFLTLPGLEFRISVVQPVASRYTGSQR